MFPGIKYQTARVTIPSGVKGASIPIQDFKLDTNFIRATGMYIPETESFGPPIRMSVQDKKQTYQQLTHIRDYVATVNVPYDDRFKDIDIEAKGNKLELHFERIEDMAEAVSFDIVFLLKK
ncbi:MAG: hypothetical protein AAFO91_02100 [Bacteroidota bacterium]